MENLIKSLILHQWQRKLVALFSAMLLWFFVNQTIITTKTIPSVPIRIVNLPNDHTVVGLLPNGFLTKRMTLTLTGTKDIIEQLEPGDLELVIDVSNQSSEGLLNITKKNLVSLNPNLNLTNHINAVDHLEYILKMSPTLTENVPVTIQPPIGDPPEEYDFLDIWPITLTQKVSGPQDLVLRLKEQGLELTFNLDDISKEDLDGVPANEVYDDFITFNVPEEWKKIAISLPGHSIESINDPEAKNLYMSFLRKKLIPLTTPLPIHVFYPLKNSKLINPASYPVAINQFVKMKNDIPFLTVPLYVSNVSRLFLEIVSDNIELQIVAVPKTEREKLGWSIGFVNRSHLEDTYVAYLLSHNRSRMRTNTAKSHEKEKYLRLRFRNFIQNFNLNLSPERKLEIDSILEEYQIRIHVPNAPHIPLEETTSDAD